MFIVTKEFLKANMPFVPVIEVPVVQLLHELVRDGLSIYDAHNLVYSNLIFLQEHGYRKLPINSPTHEYYADFDVYSRFMHRESKPWLLGEEII